MNKKFAVISTLLAIFVAVFLKNKMFGNENQDIIEISDNKESQSEEIEDEKIKIHIIGEIINPGLYEIDAESRVYDAIACAGGVTQNADLTKVNLAYILSDGEKIYIPSQEDETDQILDQHTGASKININLATKEQLMTLPGIGESVAQSIIDYRNKNGKFSVVEDIKKVSGIGESKFEKIEQYISVK